MVHATFLLITRQASTPSSLFFETIVQLVLPVTYKRKTENLSNDGFYEHGVQVFSTMYLCQSIARATLVLTKSLPS